MSGKNNAGTNQTIWNTISTQKTLSTVPTNVA